MLRNLRQRVALAIAPWLCPRPASTTIYTDGTGSSVNGSHVASAQASIRLRQRARQS